MLPSILSTSNWEEEGGWVGVRRGREGGMRKGRAGGGMGKRRREMRENTKIRDGTNLTLICNKLFILREHACNTIIDD